MLLESRSSIRVGLLVATCVLTVAYGFRAQTGTFGQTSTFGQIGASGSTSGIQGLPSQTGVGTASSGAGGAATGNRLHHAIGVEQGTITITGGAQPAHQSEFFIKAFEDIVLAVLDSIAQGISTLGNSVTGGRYGLSGLNSTGLGTTNTLGTNPLGTFNQNTTGSQTIGGS